MEKVVTRHTSVQRWSLERGTHAEPGARVQRPYLITGLRSRRVTLSAALVFLSWCALAAQSRSFEFAGLSLGTTMAELRTRYPQSTFLDAMVYVSQEESHDDISTISLTTDSSGRTLSITFERQQRDTRTYPPCEKLLAVVKDRHGDPLTTVSGQEERARNRRFVWKKGAEAMTLSCFGMSRQPFYAERLTITDR